MSELLSRVLVPIANESDAIATYDALRDHFAEDTQIIAVNVIEKAGGGIDKAGVQQRKDTAEEAFEALRGRADVAGLPIETEIRYGTDVAETIVEAAGDHDATAIAFRSRGGGRIVDFLSGSVRTKLVTDCEYPVIVLPRGNE